MGLTVQLPDLNERLRAIDRAADRRTGVFARRFTNRMTRQIMAGNEPDLSSAVDEFADLVLDVMVASHLRALDLMEPTYALSQKSIDKALKKSPKYVRDAVRELYASVARSIAEKPMSHVREALIQQAMDNGKLVGLSTAQKKENIRKALKKAGIALDESPVLQTVLWTQGAMAFNAAFWTANTKKPKLWGFQYMTQKDERVRDTHLDFEPRKIGVRYPKEHVFWRRYAPPNGWRCRCYLRQIMVDDKDAKLREFPGTPDVPASFQFNPGMLFQMAEPPKRAG